MYLIVKGISYSTINSSLSMSSLCNHCSWRTTASNRIGDRMKHKPTWNSLTTSLLLQLWRMKIKRRVKSCNLSKGKIKTTSTELLLGIYLTKLNEEERRRRKSLVLSVPGLGRGKRLHTPHCLSLCLPAAGSLHDWLSCGLGTSGFLSQYSDPLHLHTPSISLPRCSCFNWPSI